MASDIKEQWDAGDNKAKIELLSSHDLTEHGVLRNTIIDLLEDTEVSDSFTKQKYDSALRNNIGDPTQYSREIAIALQNTSASIQTPDQEFIAIIRAAVTYSEQDSDGYDTKLALQFAVVSSAALRESIPNLNQETINTWFETGQLGINKNASDESHKDKIVDLVQKYLVNKVPNVDNEGTAIADTIRAAEAEEVTSASIAENSANTADNSPPTEEDVGNYKQCMLMLEFLKKAATFSFNNESGEGATCTIWGETLDKQYGKLSHNSRIIPLWCKRPDVFLNACNFNPKFKRYFSRKSTSDDSEYSVSLFYVHSISDGNGTITGIEEIELNTKDIDCTLETVNIDYAGTTPATARKDVKVKMSWTLKNFNFLKKDISFGKKDFKFYELITVPYGVAKGSTVGGSSLKTQYSPDYSRIRLKIKSRSNLKEYDLAADGRIRRNKKGDILYKEEEDEIVDDYYIDLAITNHKMERDDSEKKNVKVTIDYRGYFENLLSMPFMDALVSRENLNNRFARDRKLNNLSEQCNPQTFREIVRLNRIGDSGEVTLKDFSLKLISLGSFYNYKTDASDISSYLKSGTNSLDASKSYITDISRTGDIPEVEENFSEGGENLFSFGSDPEKKIKSILGSSFCRLGDIMEAALSQIHEANSNELLKEFKHLNLKFVFAPVTMINPFDTSQLINFNPLEMPIDYQFFQQWYNSNVVSKKLTYYPILTFVRDLTERVINGILFESCLGSMLPDEKPPMLRSAFFYSNRPDGELHQYDRKGYYLDLDGYIDSRGAAEKIFQYKKDNGTLGLDEHPVTNYCVIFPMNSNFFNLKGGVPMKNSRWIPTFRSGTRWSDGFMGGLTFTQKNQKSGLREAKFFNTGNGLQVLSNVYDFSFTLDNVKPNNMLFPGQLIWFELWDFDNADIDPNTLNTLANVLTMGGYYMIKSVSHTFNVQKGKFTIKYDTLWTGSDTNVKFRRHTVNGKTIEENEECRTAYQEALERARVVDKTTKNTVTSIEEIEGTFFATDEASAERILRQINEDRYDFTNLEEVKAFEGKISRFLQESGKIYESGTAARARGQETSLLVKTFIMEAGTSAQVSVTKPATADDPIAEVEITYQTQSRNSSGMGAAPVSVNYVLNVKTGNMIREN